MRLLWEQHVAWTRMAITALVFKLPDADFVIARLLRNATDMGNSLRPFYGDQVAEAYSKLISEHLMLAADLVNAAIEGNSEKVTAIEKKWYQNADEIVAFLNHINPYIDKEEMRKMFYSHLALTKLEAVYMIEKKYKQEVEVFDQIEAEALEMADMISKGIFMQFPSVFTQMV